MYITQDIERLGVPPCSKVQNEKKKGTILSDRAIPINFKVLNNKYKIVIKYFNKTLTRK